MISEENTSSQTFEAMANTFHQFFTKPDFFKIGCALVTLLQNKDLVVHPTQRLVCIYFLYDMYRTEQIKSNPFSCVFFYLVVNIFLLYFFLGKNEWKKCDSIKKKESTSADDHSKRNAQRVPLDAASSDATGEIFRQPIDYIAI